MRHSRWPRCSFFLALLTVLAYASTSIPVTRLLVLAFVAVIIMIAVRGPAYFVDIWRSLRDTGSA
jgi:hypothetical protein